jgi:hypothetical protein
MARTKDPKFLVDFMLGRLAKWLRILGYDTCYFTERSKPNLLLQSLVENRVLITRDHSLSRKKSWKLILIKSDRLGSQLLQMINEEGIEVSISRFFSRCSVCNGPLHPLENMETVKELVPDYIYRTHTDFVRCGSCGKVYWKGTHLALMLKDLAKAGIRMSGI